MRITFWWKQKKSLTTCKAPVPLIQRACVERHEILVVQVSAIHGAILLGEEIGKTTKNGGMVSAAQLVQVFFGAERVVELLFFGKHRGVAGLNAAKSHVKQIVNICLLIVRMRNDRNAVSLVDDVDDLFYVRGEKSDLCLNLRLKLLGRGKGVGNKLR